MKVLCWALCLGIILLMLPALVHCNQIIRIKIISAKDGEPLKDQSVSISLLYEKTQQAPPNTDTHLQLHTNANGEALLRLPNPPPAHLGTQVNLTSDNWRCACTALVTTQDVIAKGLTVAAPAKKSDTSPHRQAQPGEILFSPRPLTFFERLLEPFVKQ